MRDFLFAVLAWAMSPVPYRGHRRIRDVAAFWLTTRVPGVYRLRAWWVRRREIQQGTPRFRASDYAE